MATRTLCFSTTYHVGTSLYGAELYARSRLHARWIAWRRGIGEKVISQGYDSAFIGYTRCSMILVDPERTLAEKLHALSWLSYLAISARVASPSSILGDRGLIHELAHCYDPNVYDSWQREQIWPQIVGRVVALEKKVPGYLP